MFDFTPTRTSGMKLLEFAQQNEITQHTLRLAINAYVDATLDVIADLSDAELTFEPIDEQADDPYAPEAERRIGWNLAHLVLHITASLEEGAAFGSILARGVEIGGRLRYEPDWRAFTTKAQVVARLEECRRMCLAYLDTWPNPPHLETYRQFEERAAAFFGKMNAVASVLGGLRHWDSHLDQLREVRRQALAALRAV